MYVKKKKANFRIFSKKKPSGKFQHSKKYSYQYKIEWQVMEICLQRKGEKEKSTHL